MSDAYLDFLRSKIPQAEVCGFEPLSEPHPSLFPHQVDIARRRAARHVVFKLKWQDGPDGPEWNVVDRKETYGLPSLNTPDEPTRRKNNG